MRRLWRFVIEALSWPVLTFHGALLVARADDSSAGTAGPSDTLGPLLLNLHGMFNNGCCMWSARRCKTQSRSRLVRTMY